MFGSMTEMGRAPDLDKLNGNGNSTHGSAALAALARASEACMQQQHCEREKDSSAAAAAAAGNDEAKFKAVIAPLEYEAGKALAGGGRESCLAAFFEKPLGFAICAEDALNRATVNPLGLLIRMVRDGDHRRRDPLDLHDDEPTPDWSPVDELLRSAEPNGNGAP